MTPLVSIIVPAYNAEKFLPETLASVLAQTYPHWELLIVDDGSKDGTGNLLKAYLADARIQYYYKENGGVSRARNYGIERAKGEYLAFLDADDVWVPDNLEKKIKLLNDPAVDWVFSDAYVTDAKLQVTHTMEGSDEDILRHYLLWDRTVVPGPCSNLVIKRHCLANGLRFDPEFSTAADQDFCFHLSKAHNGRRIAEALWYYRVLSNSMSKNIAVMEKDHIGVYRKAQRDQLFENPRFERECFSRLYLILAGSWWKDGHNKARGLRFMSRSFFCYPSTLIHKLIHSKA